jgi:uncharacterized membrane protein
MDAGEEKIIYEGFWISVGLKGIISVAEIVAGIVIFFIAPTFILHAITQIAHSGIVGSPTGVIASQLLKAIDEFTHGTQIFIALYLFSRGLIKTIIIAALFKNKLWAYPAALVVLGLFVLYQAYQILTTHSLLLIGVTIFDLIVMFFIWEEYRVVESHLKSKALSA